MKSFVVKPHPSFKGGVSLLGDKSIAHRAAILSAISRSEVRIDNFPANQDCLATLNALKKLGVKVKTSCKNKFSLITYIKGRGLCGLSKPAGPIFIKESGTTFRMITGILAGQDFSSTLSAGSALSKRPMARIAVPLRKMGALVKSKIKKQKSKIDEYPPFEIRGGKLKAITYKMPVASAQVKSAILLAALYARGKTSVIESLPTRDHTERMFKLFEADIKADVGKITVKGGQELASPRRIYIPGDISSAAFFMVLAAITARSRVTIRKVSLNPSRIGVLRVLKRMGGEIKIKDKRFLPGRQAGKIKDGEPLGDVVVCSSKLKGVRVGKKEMPLLIDELPILMVAACFAKGRSVFEGAGELRFKETDRIRSMSENLSKMGARISIEKKAGGENIVIRPCGKLLAAKVRSFGDHRTAMSMIVAGFVAEGATVIDDISCINKSFPNFIPLVNLLKQ